MANETKTQLGMDPAIRVKKKWTMTLSAALQWQMPKEYPGTGWASHTSVDITMSKDQWRARSLPSLTPEVT